MSLLRYANTPEDGLVIADDGDWVLHADAEAALAEAQALALHNGVRLHAAQLRIAKLERMIDSLRRAR